jgi:hypothetical protein
MASMFDFLGCFKKMTPARLGFAILAAIAMPVLAKAQNSLLPGVP